MNFLRPRGRPDRMVLVALLLVPVLVSLGAAWVFNRPVAAMNPLRMANLVGPTAEGLLDGRGLTFCTEDMGTIGNPICFHAARMPIPSLVVALAVALFGEHFMPVAFFKLLLLLLPLEGALVLAWRRLPRAPWRRYLVTFLLLVPFAMTPLVADVVNVQVEEGYTYSFLALAVAILFFTGRAGAGAWRSGRGWPGLGRAVLFAFSIDALYLSKSSMAPAVLVLLAAFVVLESRTMLRWLVLLLAGIAPAGWAVHQHHASGRYALGTSVDGFNLHKGNNAGFLERYPPPANGSLDRFDPELNRGVHFADEWSFNDFHQERAIRYMRSHPRQTIEADGRKLMVIFVTLRKLGSAESRGVRRVVEVAGVILFRVLLWAAIGCSVYGVLRPRRGWGAFGGIFLALLAACALPYVLGFAYMRHVSVLIYPVVLLCCAVVMEVLPDGRPARAAVTS